MPMHSEQDVEQLRTEIWDEIYRSGPQLVTDIADQRQLPRQTVVSAVEHDWFVLVEDLVSIAES